MTAWDSQNQKIRDALLEGFASSGFEVQSSTRVEGEVSAGGRTIPLDITIPPDFPYAAPRVRPIDGSGGLSWHCDPDGHLCLWADEESGDLPWQTAEEVINRTEHWFDQDLAGWPDDTPDLDLERYWPRIGGLVTYENLEGLVGREVRLQRDQYDIWKLKPGPAPKNGKHRTAAVVDLGDLERPLRSFEDILERSGVLYDKLERGVPRGRIGVIVARYSRAGESAVLALVVTDRSPVTLKAATSADTGDATRHLRAGGDRPRLLDKRVAIVGVGAVGSFIADLLARAGIGHLTLIDRDVIRPGNCIRHLVGLNRVGQTKVEAVREILIDSRLMLPARIAAQHEIISSPEGAEKLLLEHDLTIDATANGAATRLLLDGADFLGRPVISACVTHSGRVVRIDRAPLIADEKYASLIPDEVSTEPALREGGCGDPVSPAPMWAASVAAARAVAVAVDILVDRHQYPPSLVDVLVADDVSYPSVGTVE